MVVIMEGVAVYPANHPGFPRDGYDNDQLAFEEEST
jgi:hypothetical protein